MIKIINLSKSYFSHPVLEGVDLQIPEGKMTTLLGENGSGKSTLLSLMAGHEWPDQGQVTYKDIELNQIRFPYKHDIYFVHEKLNYYLSINMHQYIELIKKEIPHWNEELFLKMQKDRKIDLHYNFQNYSRGQKMQVALMMALASSAKVLLLDEITSVIDIYGRKYFLDLLDKYVDQGNSVVITTNIINELEFYTDHLVVLKDKKIVLNNSVENIPQQFVKIRNPGHSAHAIFSHPQCIWAGVNSDKSLSYIIPKALYLKAQIPQELLDRRHSTLEDVFIYYFSQGPNFKESDEDIA